MERLRRKPYLFGIAAAAIVLGLATMQFARPSRAENPRLERYLPADAVGFIQVNDLRAQALKIVESEAWREFTKQNQAASSLFMMTANHAGALDASYAVALLGAGQDAEGRRRPEVVMIAEFNSWGARRTFENRVLRFVREAGEKGVTKKEEKYEKATINVLTREGRDGSFVYAQSGETLYLSNSAAAVKRALDVKAGKAQSLETNATFAQARSRSGAQAEGLFGFLDGAALKRLIDEAPAGEGRSGAAAFRELFHGVGADGVQSASFTSAFDDGRVVERFVVNAPEKGGVLAAVAANPPTPQALLAFVPEDAVAAFDASIAGAPNTFEEMLALFSRVAEQNGKKSPADALSEFASKTGVDLRADILASLGTEVCLAQLANEGGHGGVLILNLKDEAAFAGVLARFAENHKRAVSERDYKGVTVRSIAGEKGRGVEYAFVGGNLIASDEGALVERVIDTARGGRSLGAGEAYRAASANLTGQPQFVYYNSNADYLNRLGRMLKGSGQEFKSSGQGTASLRPSFAYGLTRPKGFYVESRTPL
ncbi:MAG TPA: DUF3352 domain-containing protein, partial [Pyrinomonadaceae bacterium]|nr:DUF3352 domain-containing protein [Pyrinomonadaceae bacterium]